MYKLCSYVPHHFNFSTLTQPLYPLYLIVPFCEQSLLLSSEIVMSGVFQLDSRQGLGVCSNYCLQPRLMCYFRAKMFFFNQSIVLFFLWGVATSLKLLFNQQQKRKIFPSKKQKGFYRKKKKQKGKIFEPSHTLDGDSSLHHKQGFGCSQFTKE